jgi:cytochrome bd-type quinol oxidase subunit 1
MLFGWKRVGARLHFLATVLVAPGSLFSTFWILASNSWMQTPQGFEIVSKPPSPSRDVVLRLGAVNNATQQRNR